MKKKRLVIAVVLAAALAVFLGGSIFAARNSGREKAVSNDSTVARMTEASQLEEHAAAIRNINDTMAETFLQDVICTVSFSRYLTAEEFAAFMEEYDFEVVQLQGRGIDRENGDRVNIAARMVYGLDRIMSNIQQTSERHNYDFKGFASMYALMDSDTVLSMGQDEDVYLVDTSADLYSVARTEGGLFNRTFSGVSVGAVRNARLSGGISDSSFPKSLTWEMENFGLIDPQ